MTRSQPLCPAAELPPGATRKFTYPHEGIRREGFAANVRGHLVAYENVCRHIPMPLDDDNDFFTTDGNFANNFTPLPPEIAAAVRTGNMNPPIITPSEDTRPKRTAIVRVEHYNSEVLAALESLTEKNFGYNRRDWNLWWAAEKNLGAKTVK